MKQTAKSKRKVYIDFNIAYIPSTFRTVHFDIENLLESTRKWKSFFLHINEQHNNRKAAVCKTKLACSGAICTPKKICMLFIPIYIDCFFVLAALSAFYRSFIFDFFSLHFSIGTLLVINKPEKNRYKEHCVESISSEFR